MDEDLGRYESAAGWEPEDPWKKQRDKFRKEQGKELQPSDSMIELRPASQWTTHGEPPAELYGPLWREGELAVLIGEHASGKSILAVQLAEEIARGTSDKGRVTGKNASNSVSRSPEGGLAPVLLPSALTTHHSSLTTARPEAVLYIDFQRTAAQWAERYSAPLPIAGDLPVHYQFAENFDRAGIDWTNVDLNAYNRDPVKFALHSIFNKIEDSGAKVVIIDDIQLGGANALGTKGILRTMQTLKMWAATEGLSILILARVSSPRVSSPHVSRGLSKHSRLSSPISRLMSSYAIADSIFSIHHSTFGPNHRYVKGIKHSALSNQHSTEVLAYSVSSPHVRKGLSSSSSLVPCHSSLDSPSLATHHSSFPPTPFLGLTFLGMSAEEDHLRDYAAEVRKRVEDAVRIQRHALDSLPNDFLDVEVLKYLKS